MTRIIIIIIASVLFLIFFLSREIYELKIEIKTNNIKPIDLDENYAKSIEQDILNINGVKDLVIFSSVYGINIYCKFNYFSDKEKLISEIQRALISYNFEDIKFDDKYYLKYNCFIVVNDKKNNYHSLKLKTDLILQELLKFKIAYNVKIFGLQQEAINIYLSDDDLLKYDLSLNDIKEKIKVNNLNQVLVNKEEFKTINTKIKCINDIEDILIDYKNSKFSLKFKDIFEIKKEIKNPIDGAIYWNDSQALLIALSLKKFNPIWLLKLKLMNLDVEVINPKFFKKTEIYLPNDFKFNSLYKAYLDIQKSNKDNALYFLALASPKTNNNEQFSETLDNRIIVMTDNLKSKNLNNKIFFTPSRAMGIEYYIDEYKIKQLSLSKKDVLDSMLLSSAGVYCGYFYSENNKFEIYLKSNSDFIYSKKFKALIHKNEVLKAELKANYRLVMRKNFQRIEFEKTKTPFKFKRGKIQIR
ncbi:MAG: efflux RND transporter permease subunit [Candidatus Gastranaerophilales bacterium]|nr:efflux RND transporter permease subunit [Candidatus Gastranaerophilales bacterium]